ncbi:sugar ABC transporter ATP-binding protein [Olsenella sp. HMSC062G07]|uniref:sugar ABC transporter ATP-binding protein n=1 Tax=Olsenella sp. HMSC062G07 TaxID=1739330 RepID=UPI0008A4F7C1|nr:sugar ABC transporter ATP-binding protein [Olsenella sp. HMSC062G07]OFK23439.1 ribose ABC transporter ATP-binding protein [Olsenella sp. HMSC062G07]
MSELLLETRHICKSFSGVPVLQDVHFDVRPGEVHALMGENGAGKSTLIKIITGVYAKDQGELIWDGKPVQIDSYQDCHALGISCIYQELSIIPPLTVAQNVYLNREPRKGPFIDYATMEKMTQKLIDRYDFPLEPSALTQDLGMGQRQLVEILKGLSSDSKLLIMDEPTSSLSGKETRSLFKIINALREQGVSIIYISHRLEEVYALSDRVTILRDGKNAAVLEGDQITPKVVIEKMLGKAMEETDESSKLLRLGEGEVRLDVRGLTDAAGRYRDVSFQVHKGEILGIGGLIGAGRSEVVRAIYGIDKAAEGQIVLDGRPFAPSPCSSIAAGIGFVPEDRRSQGFVPLLSTVSNVALTNYDIIHKNGLAISAVDERELGKRAIDKIDIRPSDPDKEVGLMSGGNQQKVVLGKWLVRDLRLLIVDEPTAGIDVGAKKEIYDILDELASQGVSVIVVSSDLQELIRVSHRIIVMRKGGVVREFRGEVVTQAKILAASQGVEQSEGNAQ